MRKLLGLVITVALVLISSFFIVPFASATDVCSDVPHSSADYYVETSQASWLMSQSCVDSSVVVTMPAGSVMHVIGKTEGWHKLVTEDGHTGWMWEDFVTSTSKTFNPAGTEPEPTPEPEPEIITYDPMYDIYGHKYEKSIWDSYNRGTVQGYEDGSFKPDQTINRAELLKVIVEANKDDTFYDFENVDCFTDIKKDQWYSIYVCYGEAKGYVQGYSDGSFKPEQPVNFVEGLKMRMKAEGLSPSVLESEPWYKGYVTDASVYNYIPLDITSFDAELTRGQMTDILARVIHHRIGDLEEYLENLANYTVTYETIEDGINIETFANEGVCLVDGTIYEDGEQASFDSGCFSCDCNNGDWDCECINDSLEFFTYTNETYGFSLELPSTWGVEVKDQELPGDQMVVTSSVDEDRYFHILFVGLDYTDAVETGETDGVTVYYLGDTDNSSLFMRTYSCENSMPTCDSENELSWTITEELSEIPATFETI